MESTRPIWASSSTPAILAGTPVPPASAGGRHRVSYSSGTRVGVARVRVCFLKKAGPGATNRQ